MRLPRNILQISAKLLSLSLILCSTWAYIACNGNPTGGGDKKDTTRPSVIFTSPADADTTVSVNAEVSASFSEPMSATSMIDGVLTLSPAVSGSISYANATVTFTPAGSLDTNVTYTATVATTAADTAGNTLAAPFVWQFKTYLDTIRPVVVLTDPADSDSSATVNKVIQVQFSEAIDTATFNAGSFSLNPAVTGTFQKGMRTMTFVPDMPLDTFQTYTGTVTTAVTDTVGNHMAADYAWSFYINRDNEPPQVNLDPALSDTVIGDSVELRASAIDNDRMSHVEFYINGGLLEADSSAPYAVSWLPSGLDIASEHIIHAIGYDETGNSDHSDTAIVTYLWRLLVADPNEPLARNLSNIFYRESGLQLQFRVEHYNGWNYYKDSIGGIDVAFFFDTDRNQTTGQTTVAGGTFDIGDIGAEYRIIVGRNGDVFERWDDTGWVGSGFVEDLQIGNNSNFFEVSLTTARLAGSTSFDFVAAFVNGDDFPLLYWDFAPDTLHVSVTLDGASPSPAKSRSVRTTGLGSSLSPPDTNPFD